jgi:PAS domain S-box-containing protein
MSTNPTTSTAEGPCPPLVSNVAPGPEDTTVDALAAILGPFAALRHPDRTVRGQLMRVVLVTSALVLLIAGAALITHDLSVYRRSWTVDLTTQANILAVASGPALVFDDSKTAQRYLDALRAQPTVVAAALYDLDGRLFARYARGGEAAPPPGAVPPLGAKLTGSVFEYAVPVVESGDAVGTLFLRGRYDVADRVLAYAGILVTVGVLSMGIALLLSTWLQRIITAPLEALARVALQVVHRHDYSLRVQSAGEGEVGVVITAVNRMLTEVQSRTQDLEQANSALQREVAVREHAEAALARANARRESAMEAAEIGTWVWDVKRNEITVDRNLARLCAFADEKALAGDPGPFHGCIHPDDRAKLHEAEQSALSSGVLSLTEVRIPQPDGSVRWVTGRGRVQRDEDGNPAILGGLLIDITARKRAEEAVRERELVYRTIGESISYGVWVSDAEGRMTYASDSFLQLTGLTQEECSGYGLSRVLHPDELDATLAAWQQCVATGAPWYRELRVRGKDGQYHAILARGLPVRDETGRITAWAGLQLDIGRLKRTEEALLDADRRKDEFLAILAHELRNPLAPIRHAARLLASNLTDDDQRQWAQSVIARQSQHMALLLDDLLDVSRITRGQLALRKTRVQLSAVVNLAVEAAEPLIKTKRHTLIVSLPPAPLELEADHLRLSQVISNLLTNAAKYTDEGGEISLRATVDADVLTLSVRDNGIGIRPEDLPNLFAMFSQVHGAMDRAEGGMGIGLALARGLVELHGGRIEARSEGPGRGSEFVVRLTCRESAADGVALPDRPAAADAIPSSARHKVLVADDNRDGADALALLLSFEGFDVTTVYNGADALAAGARERPAAVLLDVGMPGLSGYETAQRARAEPWGQQAILIAVTGWGQEDDKRKAREAGFDHHLTKPVDPALMGELLTRLLGVAGGPESAAPKDDSRFLPG